MKIQNGGGKKGASDENTDWGSIWIGSVVCFLTATQFSIYFSSLWPYLLQLDDSASESFFGVIAAVYSLGQAISSPIYGFWSNRINQTKFPTIVGITLTAIGNVIYILLPLNIINPKYMMMISRAVMGTGGGIIALLKTSAVTASTTKDRARAISLNTGAFSLGLTVGPALQIFFTPLSYPGIQLIGNIRLNLYSGPAISGLVANAICLALLHFVYTDSNVGLHKVAKMENESHERFFALPKFDWIAAAVCIFTRFAQMFVVTNLETIGSPLSMTMFAWDRETSVFYNSLMHGAFSIVGFIIYAANTIFNFGPRMNHRLSSIIGLLIIVAFHLLTYPWPFLSGKIKYQEETWINGTEPVGCRRSFDWCETTPPINVYVYMISYSLMVSTAFALISVSMNTVYSVIIGPRNQGTMQGILIFIGSCARLTGPILVSSLFVHSGIGIPWIIEMVIAGFGALLWVVFYRRLVPLKMEESLSAGDRYRNKHGMVYKF
ncbi:hypothetical protein PENTCL1PPCAC_28631, partial [Pristionchus entomophagus]